MFVGLKWFVLFYSFFLDQCATELFKNNNVEGKIPILHAEGKDKKLEFIAVVSLVKPPNKLFKYREPKFVK